MSLLLGSGQFSSPTPGSTTRSPTSTARGPEGSVSWWLLWREKRCYHLPVQHVENFWQLYRLRFCLIFRTSKPIDYIYCADHWADGWFLKAAQPSPAQELQAQQAQAQQKAQQVQAQQARVMLLLMGKTMGKLLVYAGLWENNTFKNHCPDGENSTSNKNSVRCFKKRFAN